MTTNVSSSSKQTDMPIEGQKQPIKPTSLKTEVRDTINPPKDPPTWQDRPVKDLEWKDLPFWAKVQCLFMVGSSIYCIGKIGRSLINIVREWWRIR